MKKLLLLILPTLASAANTTTTQGFKDQPILYFLAQLIYSLIQIITAHPLRTMILTIIILLIAIIAILLSIRKTAEYIYYKITAKPNTKLPKTAITITLLTILTAAFKILAIITIPLIALLAGIKLITKTITYIINERRKNQISNNTINHEKKNQVIIEQIE